MMMSLVEDDTTEDQDLAYFVALKWTRYCTYMNIPHIKSGFCLKSVCLLKDLRLRGCTLSYKCLNSLPDTLLSLEMRFIHFEDCDFREIELPIHLRSLSVEDYLGCSGILSDFVNRDKLDDLADCTLILKLEDSMKAYTRPESNESVHFQLGKFLHELPLLKHLYLNIDFQNEAEYRKEMIQHLSLNTLDSLCDFSFQNNGSGFELLTSYLPLACLKLQLWPITTISGKFSETLKALDIDLNNYTK
ncbi:unnamed protein product [Ambrosiozyma monospora]|uniref:Unnamed protein product n=1 Tax=Ambrosiozyma monospora TaxID=43982 RepID=A0ACB5TEM0_AMBMO|nr:unnamed protein product [Ambrosiozyma monospora]